MTIDDANKLTPFERALLDELVKIRRALEALSEDF
jgi:hypothetical protein